MLWSMGFARGFGASQSMASQPPTRRSATSLGRTLSMRTFAIVLCLAAAPLAHGFVAAPRSPARAAARTPPPQALLEVAPASFNLALGSLALGSVFGVPGSPLKNRVTAFVPGALLALFGAFLIFQTATLRFTFDDKQFSLVRADLSSLGENVVVGGENRWAYDKFVNYDFFPSESFPILVCAPADRPSSPATAVPGCHHCHWRRWRVAWGAGSVP